MHGGYPHPPPVPGLAPRALLGGWLDSVQIRALFAVAVLMGMSYAVRLGGFLLGHPGDPPSLLFVHDINGADAATETRPCASTYPTFCPKQTLAGQELALFTQVCMQGQGNEPAHDRHRSAFGGSFVCACCGASLFEYSAKCEAGTNRPSFHSARDNVCRRPTADPASNELTCRQCGAHIGYFLADHGEGSLGACFNQASQPSRYSTDGICLKYKPPS